MKNWPPGSHIVLETTCDEVPIIACGYKYSKRKVCCFIFAKGAGHTEPGRCYIAKWKDVHGNTMTRDIPRPQVISKYFSESNIIDIFNQGRQFDLCLEKHWVTDDGYFRLVTTLFGIIVTDCWKGYNFHLPVNHRHKGLELEDFARILARDLFENQFSSDRTSEDRAITILDDCYLPQKKSRHWFKLYLCQKLMLSQLYQVFLSLLLRKKQPTTTNIHSPFAQMRFSTR